MAKNEKNKVTSQTLELIVVIVYRKKIDYYIDVLQDCNANIEMSILGSGTASKEIESLIGVTTKEKGIIIAPISSKNVPKALEKLSQKFNTIRNGKGIAFTIPLDSIIGVRIYQMLLDSRKGKIE